MFCCEDLLEKGGASILHLFHQVQQILMKQATHEVEDNITDVAQLEVLVNAAYDRCWERLHCGCWKDVDPVWRKAFGYAASIKVCNSVGQGLVLYDEAVCIILGSISIQ